jgi:hypothetical protein
LVLIGSGFGFDAFDQFDTDRFGIIVREVIVGDLVCLERQRERRTNRRKAEVRKRKDKQRARDIQGKGC